MALSVSSLGCDRESNITTPASTDYSSRIEAQVIANCLTVQAATEEFAFMNRGVYPAASADCTPKGDNLYDLLPGDCPLINPLNMYPTEPSVWGGSPCNPGETGIQAVMGGYCINVGYTIRGTGEEPGVIIATMTNIDPDDHLGIMGQCLHFETNILYYFTSSNDGTFPRDLDTDRDLDGYTIMDHINMRGGWLFVNVFTGEFSNPVMETAYEPGSIGYAPIIEGDIVIGCIITAVGETPGELKVNRECIEARESYTLLNCRLFEKALRMFAWRNNMVFPDDINSDTDLTGRTLLEYFSHYSNPYTRLSCTPVDGTAYEVGEIAYMPIVEFGINSGYVITGAGKYPGVIVARHEYDLSEADKAIYYTGAVLRTAAVEFAERNDGVFAVDFDTDMNLDKNTILDLIPLKKLLINPVSSNRTGIINGRAAYPGETAYIGWGTGFRITSINEAGYYIIDYRWRPAS